MVSTSRVKFVKKILVPLLLLLLIAGGGVGAYFYMGKSEASVGDAPQKAEKSEGKPGAKITYIEMSPIILPIIDREGISQTVSMVISIQVNNPGNAEEVKANLPKLADAYLSDMYGTLSQKASMEGGVIKVSQLKARLVAITDKVMGHDKVDGVLLQVLQQHPT